MFDANLASLIRDRHHLFFKGLGEIIFNGRGQNERWEGRYLVGSPRIRIGISIRDFRWCVNVAKSTEGKAGQKQGETKRRKVMPTPIFGHGIQTGYPPWKFG